MTLTLAKGFRILLHSPHKGKWMYILIMLGLYLAQNSSRYMPNVLLNVDPKTIKIGFIVESNIHLTKHLRKNCSSFNQWEDGWLWLKSCLVISWMMIIFLSYTFWILIWIWLCIMYIFVSSLLVDILKFLKINEVL